MSDPYQSEDDALDDLALDLEEEDQGSVVSVLDAMPSLPVIGGGAAVVAAIYAFQTHVSANFPAQVASFFTEVTNALADAVNDAIIPPAQAGNFFFWLAYNAKVAFIPEATAYEFAQQYIVQWAQQNGWATMGPNPVATPFATQQAESANAAAPLPGTVNPPAVLPSPSVGQTTVGRAAGEIVPQTTTAPGLSPAAAAAVQAAIGVAAADILKAQAAVMDAMLPTLAPGQVTQALDQLNTAVNALEAQMAQVRAGEWPRGYQGTLQALNGGLEALHGAEQAIANLTDQMAEKASSALETTIDGVKSEADATAASVATIVDTTIPALSDGLGTLTGTVGALGTEVGTIADTTIPALDARVAATEASLALTTDECLAALCDGINSVVKPIEDGGASAGLLGTLGGLLGVAGLIGFITTMADSVLAILEFKTAVAYVVSDTESLTSWAETAASAIESDFYWTGALDVKS